MIDSYSESSDVADQVADVPPPRKAVLDFRFILIYSSSESSDVADLPLPLEVAILDS